MTASKANDPDDVPAEMVRVFRDIKERLDENSMHTVVGVAPDTDGPAFCYTVGLPYLIQCPDMVTVGFGPDTSMSVLNRVVKHMKTGELSITGSCMVTGAFGGGFRLWVGRVDEPYLERFHMTRPFNPDAGAPPVALQVVIPDDNDRFVWEEGCNPEYVKHQELWCEIPTKGVPAHEVSVNHRAPPATN